MSKLVAPQKYRVTYQAQISSGPVQPTIETVLYITGPGIKAGDIPTSLESYTERVPFHGMTEVRKQRKGVYVNPHIFAARLEEAFNQGRVTIAEVGTYISKYQWLTSGSLNDSVFRKIFSEKNGVYACKFLMSL